MPLPAPSGFARLRDGKAGSTPELAALSTRYEAEIFPLLSRFGIDRSRLQLAWDFTTSSEASNTRDLDAIRADVLPKLQAKPPVVTVVSVAENDPTKNPNIWLRIEGTIRVPLYLDSSEVGAKLYRNARPGAAERRDRGAVYATGAAERQARRHELRAGPHSGIRSRLLRPARRDQLRLHARLHQRRALRRRRRRLVGMSEPDLDQVVQDAVNSPGTAFDFVDRLHQAMVNMIALSYAVKGPLAQVPELRRFGKPLFDPDKLYYYGISQGAIFGVTMLSQNPVLDRAVLSVGGVLTRS